MISTTACDFANSFVNLAFSARSRSVSEIDDFGEARCELRGGTKPAAFASRSARHSRTCDWYRPSRRRTADFSPCGAASYSATTRCRYSVVNDRRIGFGAGSTNSSASTTCCKLLLTGLSPVTPYSVAPRGPTDVSLKPGRQGSGLRSEVCQTG